MKKLSKIKLHNAIVMDDREMKSVTGGFVTGGEDSIIVNSYTCEQEYESGNSQCNGTCPNRWEGTKAVAQTCHSGILYGGGTKPNLPYCYCR